jgi:hypothetical protein
MLETVEMVEGAMVSAPSRLDREAGWVLSLSYFGNRKVTMARAPQPCGPFSGLSAQ